MSLEQLKKFAKVFGPTIAIAYEPSQLHPYRVGLKPNGQLFQELGRGNSYEDAYIDAKKRHPDKVGKFKIPRASDQTARGDAIKQSRVNFTKARSPRTPKFI